MLHELKCWPEYFRPLAHGSKRFEFRKNDRGYKAGDRLKLLEYYPVEKRFSGAWTIVVVLDVYTKIPGLPEGYCIMNIHLIEIGMLGE